MIDRILDSCPLCDGNGIAGENNCTFCDGFGVAYIVPPKVEPEKTPPVKKKRTRSDVTVAVENNPFDTIKSLHKWFTEAAQQQESFNSVFFEEIAEHLAKCQETVEKLNQYEDRMGRTA